MLQLKADRRWPVTARQGLTLVNISLARLDDREAQEETWCAVLYHPAVQPVEIFESIGGWYAIRGLDAILTGAADKAFKVMDDKVPAKDRDVASLDPRMSAVMSMRRLAPKLGIQGVPQADYASVEEINAWHLWIRQHEAALSALNPKGDAAVFSDDACKGPRPVRRLL